MYSVHVHCSCAITGPNHDLSRKRLQGRGHLHPSAWRKYQHTRESRHLARCTQDYAFPPLRRVNSTRSRPEDMDLPKPPPSALRRTRAQCSEAPRPDRYTAEGSGCAAEAARAAHHRCTHHPRMRHGSWASPARSIATPALAPATSGSCHQDWLGKTRTCRPYHQHIAASRPLPAAEDRALATVSFFSRRRMAQLEVKQHRCQTRRCPGSIPSSSGTKEATQRSVTVFQSVGVGERAG